MSIKKDPFVPYNSEGSKLPETDYVEGSEKTFPNSVAINPSPIEETGQEWYRGVRIQTERILEVLMSLLPSNYISQVKGPFYTLQLQSAAEQIAKIQVVAQEVYSDSDFDFTRPEFLYQILGGLVNPHYRDFTFKLDSDIEHRTFLKKMIVLLLNGSRLSTVKEGIRLLTEGDIQIIEKSMEMKRTPNSAYRLADQFEFEVSLLNVKTTSSDEDHYHTIRMDSDGNGKTISLDGEGETHTHEIYQFKVLASEDGGHTHHLVSEFSENIQKIFNNLPLVMQILKPAHTLYEFRHLFREVYQQVFTDVLSMDYDLSYYEDFRKFCSGAKEITGYGATLTDRSLFTDTSKNFQSVPIGASLEILSGVNKGTYRVKDILCFPLGADNTPRSYTTSNGLSGKLTVLNGNTIKDLDQDFSSCGEGTILTIIDGQNKGNYRMEFLLESNGGRVGFTSGSSTKVKLGLSTIRLDQRMKGTATAQSYRLTVDRLGVRTPKDRIGEDVSSLFYL